MRLDKLLANRGAGTRSQIRALVRRGQVTVDGQVVRDTSHHVDEASDFTLRGEPLLPLPELAVLHKPVGVHSTIGDVRGRANLEGVGAALIALGLHPVGRLDHDSSGLLLFSRFGDLTQRLLHPRHGVEKVYVATVSGEIPAELAHILEGGIETAEGLHTAVLHDVSGQDITLSVTEGKHRMVRRMLNNIGLPVIDLRRIRFGQVELSDLPEGKWRAATEAEETWARSLVE